MTTNSLATLPIAQLKRVLDIREQLETLTLELNQLMHSPIFLPANGEEVAKRRELSAAGRARIAAAQKLRWSRQQTTPGARVNGNSQKPRLSAAGRAKVAAAVKARWVKFRAAKAAMARAR